jgi:putative protease
VFTVTKVYREAADAVLAGTYTAEKVAAWQEQLAGTFNRGFWEGGYYLGKKLGEWSGTYGSQATKEKEMVGICTHFYPRTHHAAFQLNAGDAAVGDEYVIIGKTTGVAMGTIQGMHVNGSPAEHANKGDEVTFTVAERVRLNDRLFILKLREPETK